MKVDNDTFAHRNLPRFIGEAEELLGYLKTLSYDELKDIWKCNDTIAEVNFNRIGEMDLKKGLSPSIFSYEGLQYQHMAANVMTNENLDYLEDHLRILSGLYGVVRPFDGILPYRLEMQSKFRSFKTMNLYEFWGNKIAETFKGEDWIINLASKEYSKVITKHLHGFDNVYNIVFGEIINGKIKEKGTFAKIARGEMVRFMAVNQVETIEEVKCFKELGYSFKEELSSSRELVFIKQSYVYNV